MPPSDSQTFLRELGKKAEPRHSCRQPSSPTTWRLTSMNMAKSLPRHSETATGGLSRHSASTLAFEFGFGTEPADTFTRDRHMFRNLSRHSAAATDLAPNGSMALLLANGSMSSNSSGEGDIRRALIEMDVVECMAALPSQLLTNNQIPACIWFLTKNKAKRSGAAAVSDHRNTPHRVRMSKMGLRSSADQPAQSYPSNPAARKPNLPIKLRLSCS